MTTITIQELCTEEEVVQIFPLMKDLRPYLDEERFREIWRAMQPDGYRIYAMYDGGEIVAFTGIQIRTNMYYFRHVFVHELVTRADIRSKGYGEKLLTFVHEWGREHDCVTVALESALTRVDAHRFYETKMDYDKFCYSFKKSL
ncbi:acetyltransferase (GNAT) family protein [Aneurinibacillus soli]|uniref:Aminoalkylphosphonic acid N-acetyltransferase n=1 Tax=Aneurinibacillus soli TaxID=1500254 RepID=A0A0U5BDW5_9BACL|nr:GNAT family N-acetyltransferase [Aneurinibacillus soli]PYE61703.1 acetyltransferase (GNAT) family protein [Aneurinibacillus soli]BAU28439.1 aminoalkylphosphonic acid N-acetyltransferase [Aneurinibacillus soli]